MSSLVRTLNAHVVLFFCELYTDLEIRDVIKNKIDNVSGPVQIIFSDSICLDCGEEGDVR